jgi:hypothetical protein
VALQKGRAGVGVSRRFFLLEDVVLAASGCD